MDSRRSVVSMIVPLAIIALGFFVSVFVHIGLRWETFVFPVKEPDIFNVIQIGAGILAVLIARAAKREEGPGGAAVAVALVLILGGLALTASATYFFSDAGRWTGALVFATPLALAPVLAFHALRLGGWVRMLLLMGALSLALLPYGCPRVPGWFDAYSGGLLYAAAIVGILVQFVRGFRSLTAPSAPRS